VLAADLEAPNSRFGSLRLSWRRENDSRFWRSIRAEPRHHDCHIINHFGDGLLWMVTKHESLLNLAQEHPALSSPSGVDLSDQEKLIVVRMMAQGDAPISCACRAARRTHPSPC